MVQEDKKIKFRGTQCVVIINHSRKDGGVIGLIFIESLPCCV